ncbi:MAG: hypothetical protein LDL14_03475 [Nitrospira sp.]|nr:hypothetical protein [Nitrospira sp.]
MNKPWARWWTGSVIAGLAGLTVWSPGLLGGTQVPGKLALSEPEQVVEVTIKDYKFRTKQGALRLGLPTVIKVRNEDAERHDFGSTMFEGLSTQIEQNGVIVYGRGVGGVFLDPNRGAIVRFDLSRPGKHEFRCSLHPTMTGELLILSTEAV